MFDVISYRMRNKKLIYTTKQINTCIYNSYIKKNNYLAKAISNTNNSYEYIFV